MAATADEAGAAVEAATADEAGTEIEVSVAVGAVDGVAEASHLVMAEDRSADTQDMANLLLVVDTQVFGAETNIIITTDTAVGEMKVLKKDLAKKDLKDFLPVATNMVVTAVRVMADMAAMVALADEEASVVEEAGVVEAGAVDGVEDMAAVLSMTSFAKSHQNSVSVASILI